MKSLTICVAVLLFVNGAFAQDIPGAVKDAFSKKFPSAKNVKWSKESDTEFEAEFKTSAGEQSANFDGSGKWLETETEISEKALPSVVQQTIKKEFSGYKIEESEKVETPDRGSFFEIELEQGENTIVAEISSEGKVLKQGANEKKHKRD